MKKLNITSVGLPALALAVTVGAPVHAQPADPGAPPWNVAADSAVTVREWNALREATVEIALTDPTAAIARYKHFYEQRGHREPRTAVAITSLIAQLYHQGLGNKKKAIEIYEWSLKEFAWYKGVSRLQKELSALKERKLQGVLPSRIELTGPVVTDVQRPKAKTLQALTAKPFLPDALELQVKAAGNPAGAMPSVPVLEAVAQPVVVTPPDIQESSLQVSDPAASSLHVAPAPLRPGVLSNPGQAAVPATRLPPVPFSDASVGSILPKVSLPTSVGPGLSPDVPAPQLDALIPAYVEADRAMSDVKAPEISSIGATAPVDRPTVALPHLGQLPLMNGSTAIPAVLPQELESTLSGNSAALDLSRSLGLGLEIQPDATLTAPAGLSKISTAADSQGMLRRLAFAHQLRALAQQHDRTSARQSVELQEQHATTAVQAVDRAFLESGLSTKDLLLLLESGLLENPRKQAPGEDARKSRMANVIAEGYAVTLFVRHGKGLIEAPARADISRGIRLKIANYYSDQKDPRAIEVFEELLALRKKKPTSANLDELWGLATHYEKVNEPLKAGDLLMQATDYGKGSYVLGESFIRAARIYSSLDEDAKAQAAYDQVLKHCDGWMKGLALYDRARALLKQDRHDDARQLLSTPVEGRAADQIKIALLSLLGYSCYRTGEWAEAKKYAQETITLAEATNLSPGEGLEQRVMQAKEVLRLISHWERQPIVCEPRQIQVSVERERVQEPLQLQLTVRTNPDWHMREMPLDITSNEPRVTATLASEGQEGDELDYRFFGRTVTVNIPVEVLQKDLDLVVKVRSGKFPQYEAQIPIHVVVE